MRKILLALLAGLLPALSSAREQRFAFALPEVEGRISLGVFDSEGKLVRTLCVGAPESDFRGSQWPHYDLGRKGRLWRAADRRKIPGPRLSVGDALKAEGIAYHFNDWINDEKSPRITRIEDFRGSREASLRPRRFWTATGLWFSDSTSCEDFSGQIL